MDPSQQDSELHAQKKLAKDLSEAVVNYDVIKVRSLLGKGADPNHQLYWSDEWAELPPLHFACQKGNLEIVKILATHGAHIDKGDGKLNRVPLHYASRRVEVVKYLIQELKCSTDLRDKRSRTLLHLACIEGSRDVIQYLVEELKMDVDVRDAEGKSPMDRAVLGVYDSCVNVALYLMSRGYACSDEDKANLLCGVCWTGRLDMVEELVEHHKVDPENATDRAGWTPLRRAKESGHFVIVDYFKSLSQQSSVSNWRQENGPPPTKKRKAAQKVCPSCEESCHIRYKKCPECEHKFTHSRT
ncbi:ankyrin repeat domain-containing protein 7-like [Halichondria panicea]|uniref:ankyrin repeat domain-containing protein 7-like n=1 Tax=Halichondria panicea TaxID=6063 RepID=UPI00312BA897